MLEHLDDLEADFQAFYDIEDIMEVESSAKFFRLAERTFAFDGVMTARFVKMQEEAESRGSSTPQSSSPRRAGLGRDHPLAQRINITKQGGEAASVEAAKQSYLYDLMKNSDPTQN